MTETTFITCLAVAKGLRSSVSAEFALRVSRLPEMRNAVGRDNAWAAEEYHLLADLVVVERELRALTNESTTVDINVAIAAARAILRNCGVVR